MQASKTRKSFVPADDPEPLPAKSSELEPGPLQWYPGYILARAQYVARQGLEAHLAPFALRRIQFTILLLLKYNPGVRPSDIAETLAVKRANMAVLVEELFKRDLIKREVRVSDGRSISLTLSASGKRLITRAERVVTKYEMALRAAVAPDTPELADRLWKALQTLLIRAG